MFRYRLSWLVTGLGLCTASCSHAAEATAPNAASPPAPIDCSHLQFASQSSDLLGRPGVIDAVVADPEQGRSGHDSITQLQGAKVLLSPEPGVTHVDLGQTLQCRMTRRSERATTPNDSDPVAVGHVQVEVSEAPSGFMILIRSPYEEEAREILRRANELMAKSSLRANGEIDPTQSSNRSRL